MALLFSDDLMSQLSAFFGDLGLKDDVDIWRSTRVDDGQKGFRETFSVNETVKCLVISSGIPRLEDVAEQTTSRNENTFCFAPGTDVIRQDRLGWQGDLYEIIDLLDPTTYTVWQRVVAKHMEAGSGS